MMGSRHLCSQLATLSWEGGSLVVNLEEIWPEGAAIESESPVPAGVTAEIRWDDASFRGEIASAIEEEFGWHVEMEFSPETQWSPERAAPAHLFKL